MIVVEIKDVVVVAVVDDDDDNWDDSKLPTRPQQEKWRAVCLHSSVSATFHLPVVTDGAVGFHLEGGGARNGYPRVLLHTPAVLRGLVALGLQPQPVALATRDVDVSFRLLPRVNLRSLPLVLTVAAVGVSCERAKVRSEGTVRYLGNK